MRKAGYLTGLVTDFGRHNTTTCKQTCAREHNKGPLRKDESNKSIRIWNVETWKRVHMKIKMGKHVIICNNSLKRESFVLIPNKYRPHLCICTSTEVSRGVCLHCICTPLPLLEAVVSFFCICSDNSLRMTAKLSLCGNCSLINLTYKVEWE